MVYIASLPVYFIYGRTNLIFLFARCFSGGKRALKKTGRGFHTGLRDTHIQSTQTERIRTRHGMDETSMGQGGFLFFLHSNHITLLHTKFGGRISLRTGRGWLLRKWETLWEFESKWAASISTLLLTGIKMAGKF